MTVVRGEPQDFAKLARVPEVQLVVGIIEGQAKVGVSIRLESRALSRVVAVSLRMLVEARAQGMTRHKLAGHAEVDQKAASIIQVEQQVLAVASYVDEVATQQTSAQFARWREEGVVLLVQTNRSDGAPQDGLTQALANDFDFGQFRQSSASYGAGALRVK